MDKAALDKISYGLYVTGVKDEKWYGGCIVDAFMQVTLVQPTIVYSSMRKNRTDEILKPGTRFSVSVLPADVSPFIISNFGFQSGRLIDKWANVPHYMVDDLPVLTDACAYFICEVIEAKDLETHTLFHCNVIDAVQNDKPPLIYASYREAMKKEATDLFMAYKKSGKSPLL